MGVHEHILVVEDDERLAAVVHDGLAHHGYTVTVAREGAAALTSVRHHPPALVVLDRLLPDLDGIDVCRLLHATGGPPVIMLTVCDTVADKIRGLESGADDYLTKPFALGELVARVRAVLRRHATRAETLLRVGDLTLDVKGRRVWRGTRLVDLTAREFDLLDCLMQHAGQVLTTGILLERVWGYDCQVESNAVKVYVAYLRQKLNAAGDPDLIHTVRGVGYVLRQPHDL
jgi:two-component system response regulator MprA